MMTYPKGLQILLNDAADVMNWLSRHTIGQDHVPSVKPHVTGDLRKIADHLDETFGDIVLNSVVSGVFIDRGTDVVFAVIARNPELAPVLPFKNLFKDLLKICFSTTYRGKSVGDAIVDRSLSKWTGLYIPKWEPVFKSAAGAIVAESLRAEYDAEQARR